MTRTKSEDEKSRKKSIKLTATFSMKLLCQNITHFCWIFKSQKNHEQLKSTADEWISDETTERTQEKETNSVKK